MVRGSGFILLAIGFFGAALMSVRDVYVPGAEWGMIDWKVYGVFLAIGVVGVALLRAHDSGTATHSLKLEADIDTARTALSRLVETLRSLRKRREDVDVYDVHHHIDDRLSEDLGVFVEARESVSHLFGLHAYAEVMTMFASSERNINRAWSASADGYIDEVWASLDRAQTLMIGAQELLDRLFLSRVQPTIAVPTTISR